MLTTPALLLIVATTIAATVMVTAITLLTVQATRRAAVPTRFSIVLAGALLSIGASTLAVASEMYLSGHDVIVLGWVIGISALLSLLASWLVGRIAVVAPIAALVASTRRVGRGDIVAAAPTGWRELDTVAAELAETSLRLAESRAQLAELDTARKQFFAWISHDLRTPLAGMRAMAEALEEGTAADPDAYIHHIVTKIDTVNQMVGDLFELSKLQTGTLDLHPEPVDLLDLVSDAVSDVHPIATTRDIRIEHDNIDGHLLWADPKELTRAISNVLANGVRHAPDNTVILVRADTINNNELVLSVIDQGPGVTAENLGRMFDVGWRAETARTNPDIPGTGGAGLGLAIVRGIIEAHGGHVKAQHTDAGFQLNLTLPTHPATR